MGSFLPPRYTGTQVFEYIESELKDIDTDLLDRNACEYGRACKQAAYTLLAKLYRMRKYIRVMNIGRIASPIVKR